MKHPGEAVARYVARVESDPDVVGVVVFGALAWIMVLETEGAEYEQGYFDITLATVSYLDEAAENGDDPVRDPFASARVA